MVCFPKANVLDATLHVIHTQSPDDISVHVYSILLSKLYQAGMNNIEYYSFGLQINTERSYIYQKEVKKFLRSRRV